MPKKKLVNFFIKIYNKIKIQPNNFEVLVNKGSALDRLGKYDRALKYYNKALKIEPDNKNILDYCIVCGRPRSHYSICLFCNGVAQKKSKVRLKRSKRVCVDII